MGTFLVTDPIFVSVTYKFAWGHNNSRTQQTYVNFNKLNTITLKTNLDPIYIAVSRKSRIQIV